MLDNYTKYFYIVRDIIIIRKVPKIRHTRIDFKAFLFFRHIVSLPKNKAKMRNLRHYLIKVMKLYIG